jgi:hypothetical protein
MFVNPRFRCPNYVHRNRIVRRTARLLLDGCARADALDENYLRLLPSGQDNVTAEEGAMLAAMFAENGKLPARRLS